METHNHKPGDDKKVINLPEHNAKADAAGTNPDRYEYFSSGMNDNSQSGIDDNERMISPDRGES